MLSLETCINSINQAIKKNSTYTYIYYTKENFKLIKLLKDNNLILMYTFINSKSPIINKILIFFKTGMNNKNIFRYINIISKPSRSIYMNNKKILNNSTNKSMFIISTSKGWLTVDKIKSIGIGGKIILEIEC